MKVKLTALIIAALLLCTSMMGCSKPENSENGNDPVPQKGIYTLYE